MEDALREARRGRPTRRLVVSQVPPEAYVPMARAILANVGYAIVPERDWRDTPELASRTPELRIVDEPGLDAPGRDDALARVPAIVLTGRRGIQRQDPRVVGALRRPAGLHELYRLLQQALETTPRSAPRVATHLPARCRRGRREWKAEVLSLSENGCLLRSPEPLALEARLRIAFALPGSGWIETAAASTYQLPPDTGLVFEGTPAASRKAIQRFVEGELGGGR